MNFQAPNLYQNVHYHNRPIQARRHKIIKNNFYGLANNKKHKTNFVFLAHFTIMKCW